MTNVSVESEVLGCDDYRRDPWLAVDFLGGLLDRGVLTLFVGAGVSQGFGLPSWPQLVARTVGMDDSGPDFDEIKDATDSKLMELVDRVDDGTPAYLERVTEALYRTVPKNLSERLQVSPLLLAVAALTTGSVRGRIDTVITYNFDNLLECYLQMLGYGVQTRLSTAALRERCDVEVNHVHGFLPRDGQERSDPGDLIFSLSRYRERRAFIDQDWSDFVRHHLVSSTGLFLGLSGDDELILEVILRAKKTANWGSKPGGYWLMTPEAYDRNERKVRDVGICPLRLEVPEFPRFVLGMCQAAAKKQGAGSRLT